MDREVGRVRRSVSHRHPSPRLGVRPARSLTRQRWAPLTSETPLPASESFALSTPRARPQSETSPRGLSKTKRCGTRTHPLYTTAKTRSERLAWELAEEHLDLRVINPTAVLGGGFVRPTPSVDFFGDAIAGNYPLAPKFPMSVVHVRDVARAHRRAFEVDEASGRFILAPHANITLATICRRIRTLNPTTKSPKYSLAQRSPVRRRSAGLVGRKFGRQRYLTRAVART